MEISTSSNTVTIVGNIKSISDFQDIKNTLDSLKSANNMIIITIENSISITSSVIGYLNKIVLKDGVSLQLKIGNEQLLNLLDDLNLTKILKASKV